MLIGILCISGAIMLAGGVVAVIDKLTGSLMTCGCSSPSQQSKNIQYDTPIYNNTMSQTCNDLSASYTSTDIDCISTDEEQNSTDVDF